MHSLLTRCFSAVAELLVLFQRLSVALQRGNAVSFRNIFHHRINVAVVLLLFFNILRMRLCACGLKIIIIIIIVQKIIIIVIIIIKQVITTIIAASSCRTRANKSAVRVIRHTRPTWATGTASLTHFRSLCHETHIQRKVAKA